MFRHFKRQDHLRIKLKKLFPLQVKYKEKYEKEKGHYMPVQDTPQILHAKAVRTLASEVILFKGKSAVC